MVLFCDGTGIGVLRSYGFGKRIHVNPVTLRRHKLSRFACSSSMAACPSVLNRFVSGFVFFRDISRSIQQAVTLIALTSGNRNADSGALNNVGAWGGSWSSSPNSESSLNGGSLSFNSTNVKPLNGDYRANGFPVRCVKYLLVSYTK